MFTLDLKQLEMAESELKKAHSHVYRIKMDLTKELLRHAVLSVLHDHDGYFFNKEYKAAIPSFIQTLHKRLDISSDSHDRYGLNEIYHDSLCDAVFVHQCDYLTAESSFGGQYWMDWEIQDKYETGVPYYFDNNGFFIRYDTDLDVVKEAFKEFYFEGVYNKLKEIKQLELF